MICYAYKGSVLLLVTTDIVNILKNSETQSGYTYHSFRRSSCKKEGDQE